jgi:hypothetical protein
VRIACLGWGSLIWKPGDLPVIGQWHNDGPRLPIEFSRVGDSQELATALCADAESIAVLWAWLDCNELAQACAALKAREGIPAERHDGIGSLIVTPSGPGPLRAWAAERGIEALVWTALPPRVHGIEGRLLSVEDAIVYLAGLRGEALEHARGYLARVPRQIDTPIRRAVRERLGWGEI